MAAAVKHVILSAAEELSTPRNGHRSVAALRMTVDFVVACATGEPSGTGSGLRITPDSVTVAVGATAQLAVADLSGQAVTDVTWSTSDASKVTISSTGLVTALAAGRIGVSASSAGKQGTAIIRSAVALNFTIGAQITQATQSPDGSIPMVLGGNAAVVNVTLGGTQSIVTPTQIVLRLFDVNNGLIRADTVKYSGAYFPFPSFLVPQAQFLIPASQLPAIASWQVARDPKGELPDTNPADDLFPRTGRATLAKVTVPALAIKFVPIVLAAHAGATGQVSTAQLPEYLRTVRSLHPLGTINATVGTPFSTQANFGTPPSGGGQTFWVQVLSELDLARVSDVNGDPNSYWMGILVPPNGFNFTQFGGFGYIPSSGSTRSAGTRTAVAVQIGWFSRATQARDGVAHELGHNLGRAHAPCGAAASPDPQFPYAGGVIGVIGHDVYSWANGDATRGSSLDTNTGDLMGYCTPIWTSDYNYNKVLQFRGTTAASLQSNPLPVRSLIVRGQIEDNGRAVLEPAFTIVARPTAPERSGSYHLVGTTAGGRELFRYAFDPATIDHAPGIRHFLFAIPVTAAIDDSLVSITVTGSGSGAQLRSLAGPSVRAAADAAATAALSGDGTVTCGDRTARGILVVDAGSGMMLGTASGPSARIAANPGAKLAVFCSDGVRSTQAALQVQ